MAQNIRVNSVLGRQNRLANNSFLSCVNGRLGLLFSVVLVSNLGVQLFAPSLAATPKSTGEKIEQQSETSLLNNRAAAKRAFTEGQQLQNQGTAESLQQAIGKYQEALCLWQIVGNRSGEAKTLNNIGNVYNLLGERQKALDYYNQALSLERTLNVRSSEANTLNNIGYVYNSIGQKQQALGYYNQALALERTVGNSSGIAAILNNIGNVYNSIGEKQQALDYYNQALLLKRTVGEPSGIAAALNSIGNVYSSIGEKQRALDYYNQALLLKRTVGNPSGVAATLNNIGGVYDDLGQKQQALDYYNQALPLEQQVGDRSGIAATLNNIGKVYDDLGQKQQALDYYNQALSLKRAVDDTGGVAATTNNIGSVYNDLGQKQKALDYYSRSLALRRGVGDRSGQANTLNNIGNVYDDLGEQQKALDYYNQALPLERTVRDLSGEAATFYYVAKAERTRGNFNKALNQIEASLNIVESLRTKIASQQLRTSYFASVQKYYQFYIDLLMQLHKTSPSLGYDAKALYASERARARTLLELLAETHADIRSGVDPKLVELEHTLQQQIDTKKELREQLLSSRQTEAQAATLDKEIEKLLSQYQEVEAQLQVKSPRYAALTQPHPLTLSEIQSKLLDDNTLLLEYSLGNERSYLWAVTKTSIASYELPKGADIEAAAKRFRLELTTNRFGDSGKSSPLAAALSQMLLGPVASKLGQKRLVVVSDGILQYIPFTALAVPTDSAWGFVPLIVEHEIVSLPSASTLAVLRREIAGRKRAAKAVILLADPVFSQDDPRVKTTFRAIGSASQLQTSEQSPSRHNVNNVTSSDAQAPALTRSARESGVIFNRLKYTRTEARQILALVPDAQQQEQAFDFAANLKTATMPELSQYRIVHFATHGILNSTHPELSGIVLSLVDEKGLPQNGFLRLHEIYNLNLPVELVVLSGCQTGLGQDVKGEGLVGLTRGFMYAGAPRVVVSLWSIDDEATAELMTRFYRGMLKEKLTPAAALRAAQVEMLKTQWSAPYYWAAFVIQGEWK